MPTFTFTSPEGKSYDITGPDGATKEQAFGILQQKLKGGVAAPASASAAPPAPAAKPGMTGDVLSSMGIPPGIGEPVAAMASGAIAKPLSDIAGLGAIPMHALGLTGEPQDVKQRVQSALTYQPRSEAGKSAMVVPEAIGKALSSTADAIAPPLGKSSAEDAMRSGSREALMQLPTFLGMKADGGALRSGAERAMASALKPGQKAARLGQADPAVATMLDQDLNVSKGGLETLHERITALNDRVATKIQNSPAVVDKQLVGARMQDVLDEFRQQVDSAPDIKAIQRVWDRFTADKNIAAMIPVQQAQELKQGSYRRLKGQYGEAGEAGVEAKKALTRGLKEEIVKAVPEVAPLNAEESAMLNVLPMVERRVIMEAQKNPVGLGLLSTSPGKMAAWMGDRSALFKSLVARMLNKGSKYAGPVGPALGVATTDQASQPPIPAMQ